MYIFSLIFIYDIMPYILLRKFNNLPLRFPSVTSLVIAVMELEASVTGPRVFFLKSLTEASPVCEVGKQLYQLYTE